MDSRQRVELALSHQQPDRVPIDYWATREVTNKLLAHFGFSTAEELLQHFDVDFRYIEGPKYIGPEPQVHADGSIEDHWGVPRVRIGVGSGKNASFYKEVTKFPLADAKTLEEVRDYPGWPSPDWFDYECVQKQVEEACATGKVVIFMGDRLNRCAQLKPAMYLRGADRVFLDMMLNPEIADYIFTRIARFYLEYARRTLQAAEGLIDIFMTGDDFGTQSGLFMRPEMWRKFLKPGFKRFIELGHQFGCKVAHHTCGAVSSIIPDMTRCGLDILNPIQPEAEGMDGGELKRLFGKELTFHGSISIQKTLPFGRPEDVREEVKERFEALGPGGGFIFCTAHNIQADAPIENIVALFDAYHELGRY